MSKKSLDNRSSLYSWVIAAAGLVIISISYGVVLNGFGIYIIPVTEDLGCTRQSFGTCLSIINIMLMTVGFFWGKLYKTFGMHRLMKISAVVLPLSYFAFSMCRRLWAFYLCSVVIGLSTAMLSLLPFAVILANWFEKQRGLALGIGFMGTGVGGMVFSALGGAWLVAHSWQWVGRVTAVAMFLVLVPLVFFVLRISPEEKGLEPWGGKVHQAQNQADENGLTLGQAGRSASFWALILLALTLGVSSSALSGTIVAHVSDLGFDPVYAANLSAVALGAMALGKIVLGLMFDKIGMKLSTAISIFAIAAGIIGLYFGRFPAFHLLVIFGMGIGNPSATMAYPGMIRERFGMRSYGDIYGVVSASNYFGVSCTPIIVNAVYDCAGSYSPALLVIAIVSMMAVFLLNIIIPKM